jgi:DNA-binding CsgD family transcriptional regulator
MGSGTKTWKAWTPKEITGAERLRLEGLTSRQIAAKLGRTESSVKNLLYVEGVRRPCQRRLFWLNLFGRPHRVLELARRLGLSVSAVKGAKRRLRRLGFSVPAAASRAPLFRATAPGP